VSESGSGKDFFSTHKEQVVGKTVTRTRVFNLKDHGYERKNGATEIICKEVTIPIFDKTGEYVIRALRYDLPQNEIDPNKPHHSLIVMGGGASDAVGNIAMVGRIEDALKPIKDDLPFSFDRIIVVPHIAGSPRTEGKNDVAKKETFTGTAGILQKALEDSELNIVSKQGLGILGYSNGGAQAVELAAKYGSDCKYLFLAEPSGMAEQKNLAFEFSIGTIIAAFKKYREKGLSLTNSISETLWETRVAWGGVEGVPSIIDMAKDSFQKRNSQSEKLAEAYGFKQEQATTGPNISPAMIDSTKNARGEVMGEVIISPITLAKVVNIITGRLKDKYPDIDKIRENPESKNLKQEVIQDITDELIKMFPKANIHFAPYPGTTHSAVMLEQDYWNNLFTPLIETFNQPKS